MSSLIRGSSSGLSDCQLASFSRIRVLRVRASIPALLARCGRITLASSQSSEILSGWTRLQGPGFRAITEIANEWIVTKGGRRMMRPHCTGEFGGSGPRECNQFNPGPYGRVERKQTVDECHHSDALPGPRSGEYPGMQSPIVRKNQLLFGRRNKVIIAGGQHSLYLIHLNELTSLRVK
jgi:hypothetical protein